MSNKVAASIAVVAIISAGAFLYSRYDQIFFIPEGEKAIAAQMRDPSSTQFRDSRVGKPGWICGELNSKNGNGGYVGFKRYISGGKAGPYYVYEHGKLGEQTTADFIAIKDREIEFMKAVNESGGPMPTASQIREIAEIGLFETQWKEVCP